MIRSLVARCVLVGLAIVVVAGPTHAADVAARGGRPLARLAADATAVVAGTIRLTAEHDGGGLLVHHVDVDATLAGRPPDDGVAIVEIRGGSTGPRLLDEGDRVVVLLAPAPDLSYLATQLPPGTYVEVVGGRDGVVRIRDADDAAVVATILEDARTADALPAGSEQTEARWTLAFRELGTGLPRLVTDAVIGLKHAPRDRTLTAEEITTLTAVLRDTTLPVAVRVTVLALLADRRWSGASSPVDAAVVDDVAILRAVLDARTALGMPVDDDELREHLASDDPRVRAAALAALASLGDTAVDELGRFATTDADTAVRTTAIDALGRSGSPKALGYLGQTFESDDRAVKQASARALRAVGGERGAAALESLALGSESPETRRYAALVLMLTYGPDHAAVRRLGTVSTDPAVQELLHHGLEFGHQHAD